MPLEVEWWFKERQLKDMKWTDIVFMGDSIVSKIFEEPLVVTFLSEYL